jgi:serine/threonine-protein kinase
MPAVRHASPSLVAVPSFDTRAPGSRVDRFEIVRHIGSGRSAEVYEAEHLDLGRRVALKIVRHLDADSSSTLARFRREVRAAGALHHRHVVEVLDTGMTDRGEPYLVMELLEGESLADRIARGPLPVAACIEVARQLCLALSHVHSRGLLHGDVRPDNVILHRPSGRALRVKLVDFGLSRTVRAPGDRESLACADDSTVGVARYVAPEISRGAAPGSAHDVYAIGVVALECLTGHTLAEGPLPPIIELRHDCPEALARIVERAVAERPEDRYGSARELLTELESLARTLGLGTGESALSSDGDASEISGIRATTSAERALFDRTSEPPAAPGWVRSARTWLSRVFGERSRAAR